MNNQDCSLTVSPFPLSPLTLLSGHSPLALACCVRLVALMANPRPAGRGKDHIAVAARAQLHTQPGRRGPTDQRALRLDSPTESEDGRKFLAELSRITVRRAELTLDVAKGRTMLEFWERFRFRAPDAARVMWAAGALRWRNARLRAIAAQVVARDIDYEHNQPRYLSTALWGAAWAHPELPLRSLCEAVERRPRAFWNGASTHITVRRRQRMRWHVLTSSLVRLLHACLHSPIDSVATRTKSPYGQHATRAQRAVQA